MKYDKNDPKSRRKWTTITVILVILAGIAGSYFQNGGEDNAYLAFHNAGYFSLKDIDNVETDVYYKDILSIQYLNTADFADAFGGTVVDESLWIGWWESEIYGSCLCCMDMDMETCLLIQTENGNYVINYESDETTKLLQDTLLETRDKLLNQ